jgi:hypothetical protein
MIYILNFIKTGSEIQKLIWEIQRARDAQTTVLR